ncbi:MAG: hypothetical protein M3X11_10150, partial [Acidobacteriota bacterium]|nr:hypothetical protein [Acidobacteriota bacterium]
NYQSSLVLSLKVEQDDILFHTNLARPDLESSETGNSIANRKTADNCAQRGEACGQMRHRRWM